MFASGSAESSSVFASAELVEQALRNSLPAENKEIPLRVDLPRHLGRPNSAAATAGQNFFYSQSSDEVRPLTDDQLYRHQPLAGRIVRVYVRPDTPCETIKQIAAALDKLLGPNAVDDVTNM